MRGSQRLAVIGTIALLYGCGPSDEELGIVRDASGDPMIRIQASIALLHCSTDLTLRPDGSYQVVDSLNEAVRPLAECRDGDFQRCIKTSVVSRTGQLNASAWRDVVALLERQKFWTIRSVSQGYHTIAPESADHEGRLAMLPPIDVVGVDGGVLQIEWRRNDGRKKYLLADSDAEPDADEIWDAILGEPFYEIICMPTANALRR